MTDSDAVLDYVKRLKEIKKILPARPPGNIQAWNPKDVIEAKCWAEIIKKRLEPWEGV